MASVTKKCRVCGASYEACRSAKQNGVFRWQEVACSPECGAIYLAEINESRAKKEISEPIVRFAPVTIELEPVEEPTEAMPELDEEFEEEVGEDL